MGGEKLLSIDDYQKILETLPESHRKEFSKMVKDILKPEDYLESELNKYVNKKPKYEKLQYDFFLKFKNYKDFVKVFRSIWLISPDKKTTWKIDENYEFTQDEFENRYKNWLWNKLNLTKKESEAKTINDIDYKIWEYINKSVSHIRWYISKIDNVIEEHKVVIDPNFHRSPYFESIHKKTTVSELIKSYYFLDKKKNNTQKENEEIIKNNPENYNNNSKYIENMVSINWIKKALFEIQRILVLARMYYESDETLEHKNLEEEKNFLIWKINTEILKIDNVQTDNIVEPDNPFHWLIIPTRYFFYKKWDEYINSQLPIYQEWYKFIWEEKLNTKKVVWNNTTAFSDKKFENNENTIEVDVLHMSFRGNKWWASSADKMLRKDLTLPWEILDKKWLIFVVKTPYDATKLEKILAKNLSSWDIWWAEPMKYSKDWLKNNSNTNASYNSKKWILYIPYKWKLKKESINNLEKNYKDTISYYESELEKLNWEKFSQENEQRKDEIHKELNHIKKVRSKSSHNIPVEIQIFTLEEYIKAEIDNSSPAYHGHYKLQQEILEVFPKLFSKEIYWETKIKDIMRPILKKKLDIK